MARDSETSLVTELPTASEIAEILMKLVQYAGLMDRNAIEKKGQRLRPLPCVKGALEAHRLSEEDWPVAVQKAIECLTSFNGRYPGLTGKFLMRTFALDGHVGSLTSRMEDFVEEEPRWRGRDNTIKAQRTLLLTEFAGVMRSTLDYPCRSRNAPAVQKLAALFAAVLGDQRELHEESARSLQQLENSALELHSELSKIALQWGLEAPVEEDRKTLKHLVLHLYAEAELLPANMVNRLEAAERLGVKRRIFGGPFLGTRVSGTTVKLTDVESAVIFSKRHLFRKTEANKLPAKNNENPFDSLRDDFPVEKFMFPPTLVQNPTELARILLAPKRNRDTVDESSLVMASPV